MSNTYEQLGLTKERTLQLNEIYKEYLSEGMETAMLLKTMMKDKRLSLTEKVFMAYDIGVFIASH